MTEPRVIEDEFIVGVSPLFLGPALLPAIAALTKLVKQLESLGAVALHAYLAPKPDTSNLSALLLLRARPPQTTAGLENGLKKRTVSGLAFFERNAVIAFADAAAASMSAVPPADPLLDRQWALAKLGVDGPWSVAPPAGKTLVAIVDTGLRRPDGSVPEDIGRTEPAAACQPPPLPFPLPQFPLEFADGVDQDGHGTLLAGTIAAVPGNGVGLASAVYPSWGISLMPIKFFGPRQPAHIYFAAVALMHAINSGARVINASWHVGLSGQVALSLQSMVDLAIQRGCVVVAAAGNDGTSNEDLPTYPANYPGVLAVAATGPDDHKASFSNYGPSHVGIAAPGVRIATTGACWTGPARYPSYSGTSAAAAFVSSGAALIAALNPKWTAPDIVQHLKDSADKLPSLRLVSENGNRLNLRRAVYGPLQIVAPRQGARLRAGVSTTVAWANDYRSAKLDRVKIEFRVNRRVKWRTIVADTANDGAFRWKPDSGDRTRAGQIRITPVAGNFPVLSARFRVV